MKGHKNILPIILLFSLLLLFSNFYYRITLPSESSMNSDSTSYQGLINKIHFQRDSISTLYYSTNTNERDRIIKKAEEFLITTYYKTLIPKWLGTKWAFYGETQIPGDSSIACGHFVVTTLKHLGINLEDSHEMATNYSAYMVNSLCDTSYKVYKASDILTIVKKLPDNIWVVGLRSHSGLLIKYQGQIHFVHSSCTDPSMVVDELAEESSTFIGSSIYVAGSLFRNNSLTEKWIKGDKVNYTKKYK